MSKDKSAASITLANGRRFEVARINAWSLQADQYIVVDDGETIRARRIETVLGAGMIILEGEDRVRQVSRDPLVLVQELP